MSDPAEKLLVVLGATGSQGGSVIAHFLGTPGWRIRALTRDATKSSARALAAKGVELATGDLSDKAALSSAFTGATAIFAVSDFWTLFALPSTWAQVTAERPIGPVTYDLELQQAKNIIDTAAQVPTLEKFIWSSLSSARKWSNGKYTNVFHFDAKAAATDYLRSTHPELAKKTSVMINPLYVENHLNGPKENAFIPKTQSNGSLGLNLSLHPTTKLPFNVASRETGAFVKPLILTQPPGVTLLARSASMTMPELMALISKHIGIKIQYTEISDAEARKMIGKPTDDEMGDSMGFFNDFGYDGGDPSVKLPEDLGIEVPKDGIEKWIKESDWSRVLNQDFSA
ncbi:MAG: hypothetical protein Q9227_007760 [Pyrenula ochraceoflavens]